MLRSGLLAKLKHRNVLVVVNTAIAAASSVVLLLGAARSMGQQQLSDFSLVQLIIMTSVMLQRSAFLAPALSTQRANGKTVIPLSWVALVSVPLAVAIAGLISVAFGADGNRYAEWFLAGLVAGVAALAQDTLRYCLMSRGLTARAVFSDGCWLLLIFVTLFFPGNFHLALDLTIYWGLSGALAVALALLPLLRGGRGSEVPNALVKTTWRLGKWSGLDAILSAAATLSPMLMTALVLGSADAGTYRVLQSSLGPINILCTSLITMFGLNAWQLTSRSQLRVLRKQVSIAVISSSIFALLYIALAETLIIALSGLRSTDLLRIAVIVGVVGLIGSAAAPLSAAALALGYQRHGALLRLVIVIFSLLVSFLGSSGAWLPWGDPIGTVTLFASVAGLIGWSFSYRHAIRKETSIMRRNAESLGLRGGAGERARLQASGPPG